MIYEAEAGENIYSAIKESKTLLRQSDTMYGTLKFNDISIPICYNSAVEDVETIYHLLRRIEQLENK